MSESTTSSKTSVCADDELTPEVIIIDGSAKFRDGKRWKQRFCVLSKLSPAADCLQLLLYRDEKERARNGHTKASLSLSDYLAMETGFTLDKESNTLGIICQELSVVLAFDNRERLIQWSVRIANNLGDGQHFLVQLASAPTKSKLTPGPAKLHVTDKRFCLTGGIPPRLFGNWEIPHLRRYGIIEGRIVFEGGSRCGKGEGVHVLVADPGQMQGIIDSLDMSSKGQLARGASRRFGNVTDSPRKSMSSRLSEMRTLSSIPSDCTSTTNISMNGSSLHPHLPVNHVSTIPAPRESWSAEALCSACGEVNGQNPHHVHGQMWTSEMEHNNCDNSAICPGSLADHTSGTRGGHHSPARNPGGVPLQIAKPLPSAMERCLSCMSSMGQQGQDILTPSWTMDLNVSAASASMGMGGGNNVTLNTSTGLQGSIGSANSDRLSISSHGSSSGGVTAEYYYDTPRSVLVAEMRRHRSNTPPGMFQNGSSNQMSNPSGQLGTGCPSPCRGPKSHISTIPHSTPTPQSCSNQNHNGSVCGGGVGNCHFHQAGELRVGNVNGIRPGLAGHSSQQSSSGHIYYNGAVEQKSLGGNKALLQPINLHTPTASGGPGPYENYDFPRCAPSYPCGGNGDGNTGSSSTLGLNGTSSMSSIDWNKKPPMDRSSIATTASTSISLVGSSSDQEFYDTPRPECPCCTHNNPTIPMTGCPCCSLPPPTIHHHPHISHPHQHHTQNPSCILRRGGDPLENYDVPPHNNPHNLALTASNQQMQHSITSTSISINGMGKMPLVSGSIPTRVGNPNAIYAQVDKSKKTARSGPNQQPFINCDNLPIYENRNAVQHQQQPTYSNDGVGAVGLSCGNKMNVNQSQVDATSHPVGCPITKQTLTPPQDCDHSNYVNLQFAESLQLYENAKEISYDFPPTKETITATVLVHPEPKPKTIEIQVVAENDYENSAVTVPVVSNVCETSQGNAKEVSASGSGSKETSVADSGIEKDSSSTCPPSTSASAEESRRGSQESHEAVLPLRRSSSVPCKGGHANRGSASSSDSGVSGDGALFFDDSSPLNDIASLCLHESLPRKSQRTSPKNTATTTTPRPQEVETNNLPSPVSPNADPTLANRHYETIEEVEATAKTVKTGVVNDKMNGSSVTVSKTIPGNPLVAAVKCVETVQIRRNYLVSDANSVSSGNSDMSDYIETMSNLSSCSRGSGDTVTLTVLNGPINLNISTSPKKSTSMKPRSGKEYFKIDRTLFKKN